MHLKRLQFRPREQGVALITALLILSICVTASAYIIQQEHLSIRRSSNIINGNKAYLYTLGAEKLAMIVLHEDFNDDPDIDQPNEQWRTPVAFEVEESSGFVAGNVTTMQGKFNINNLVNNSGAQDAVAVERFRRLLGFFNIDPEYTNAVIDWIDPDINSSGYTGAEDDFYVGLEQPYHTPNRKIISISELRLIRGLGESPYLNLLLEHLTALPTAETSININFMTPAVKAAIEDGAYVPDVFLQNQDPTATTAQNTQTTTNTQNTATQAGTTTTTVETPFYETVADYESQNGLSSGSGSNYNNTRLSVTSQYFLVQAEAEVGRGRARLKSVIERSTDGKMRVIRRSQGNL